MMTHAAVYKCEKCGNFSTTDPEEMLDHMRFHEHLASAFIPLVHVKTYKCDKCQANFATLGELCKHELKHIIETYNEYETDDNESSKMSINDTTNEQIVNTSKENEDKKPRLKRDKTPKINKSNESKDIDNKPRNQRVKKSEQDNVDKSNEQKVFNKSFKCNKCYVSFVLESTLKTHSLMHKPLPYKCHCGIGYYRQIDYKGHLKVVHGMQSLV